MEFLIVLAVLGGVLLLAYATHLRKSVKDKHATNIVYADLPRLVVRRGVFSESGDVLFSRRLMLKGPTG